MEELQILEVLNQIDTLCKMPLAPSDYCRRWVVIEPNRNPRKAYINALARVTGMSSKTINNWGTDFNEFPEYITRILRYADLINQFKQLVSENIIALPPDFPQE